jgi:hypothetical protein
MRIESDRARIQAGNCVGICIQLSVRQFQDGLTINTPTYKIGSGTDENSMIHCD